MYKKIIEKKHRLQRELYKGNKIITFTLCIVDRKNVFINYKIFSTMEKFLLNSLKKFNCLSLVHLFMPDHCHITIEGCSEGADLWKCIVNFKQYSGFWLAKNNIKWQKDFYDHILRKEEDIKKHVMYILNNPVRKGIVENWKNYPYKGSTKFDFNEW